MAATPLGHGRPRSPDPELSRSADAAHGAGQADACPPLEPAPMLEHCMVALEDGLLMVFGPDGDPLPPGALRAVLADQPDARLRLADGTQVAAARVMAVLEAQASGRLAPDEGAAEGWIRAMLGLGPQPEEVAEAVVQAEQDCGQLAAFGNELMVALPGGRALLLTDAKTPGPASEALGLLLADGTALGIGDLIERLRSAAGPDDGSGERALDPLEDELALPDCWVQVEDDALALDFPGFGRVRLASFEHAASEGPQVRGFLPDGRAATLADLLASVERAEQDLPASEVVDHHGQSGEAPDEAPLDPPSHHPVDPRAGTLAGAAADQAADHGAVEASRSGVGPAEPAASIDGTRRQVIPLAAQLPAFEGIEPHQVAVLVVRGVPRGGALSAGVDNGDGSWLLSPLELDHLTLALPVDALRPVLLPVNAIALADRDGALASVAGTLRLSTAQGFGRRPFGRRAEAAAEQPIPLALEACLADLEGIDAIVIRDVPRGARLSTGTYDPAIAGWILRPGQLAGLALIPAPNQSTEVAAHGTEVTLTILGISLRPGAPSAPRVLGRLPVALH